MDGLIAYALSKKYVDGKTSGIATGMSWKGTKENISNLPQSGNKIGDLWHVNEDGNEYAWDGSKWEALGGIHSGSSAPFEIPVQYNGSTQTYTTTANANDIVSHFDNLVINQNGTIWLPVHKMLNGSTATIRFQAVGSNGSNDVVTFFIVTANSQADTVTIEFNAGVLAPEVTSTDNGKFFRVVNGAWTVQAVPSAESNSFGGGS